MKEEKFNKEELSMKDKIKLLGIDADKFEKDLFAINDVFEEKVLTSKNYIKSIEEEIYPILRRMKEEYGIDIPISYLGIDIIRLERRINSLIE